MDVEEQLPEVFAPVQVDPERLPVGRGSGAVVLAELHAKSDGPSARGRITFRV
ncbi:hypothetical protein [Streptomyces sp. NPDC001530]|uniref:hypothetical protein n=1 Tax=Streptomyces sp. NPDC001530 TaxID=3364582 RepID=UPI003692D66B